MNVSSFLKKIYFLFPNFLQIFLKVKYKTINHYTRIGYFITVTGFKQRRLLNKINNKSVIKVVFLVMHKSIWKVDHVFQKMLQDPCFEPAILVVPHIKEDRGGMLDTLSDTYQYFNAKNYPVFNSYDYENNNWIQLKELAPDVVWFTNPHNITHPEYFQFAYKKYLSVYVPYYFMSTNHVDDEYSMYASGFLNSMFKVFWPGRYHLSKQELLTYGIVKNGFVSGYPSIEGLIYKKSAKSVWKSQQKKVKKIIFAPHHTIEGKERSLSSFLSLADPIRELAELFSDQIQWSFKPHPLLKSKLFKNESWGVDRTEEYYKFWSDSDFSQLNEGDYDELFLQSDAIIHDCSSFISEFAFCDKPGLFLMNQKKAFSLVNEFGKMFISNYKFSDKPDEIEMFLLDVINENVYLVDQNEKRDYVRKYYFDNSPSELIIQEIKKSLSLCCP